MDVKVQTSPCRGTDAAVDAPATPDASWTVTLERNALAAQGLQGGRTVLVGVYLAQWGAEHQENPGNVYIPGTQSIVVREPSFSFKYCCNTKNLSAGINTYYTFYNVAS